MVVALEREERTEAVGAIERERRGSERMGAAMAQQKEEKVEPKVAAKKDAINREFG